MCGEVLRCDKNTVPQDSKPNTTDWLKECVTDYSKTCLDLRQRGTVRCSANTVCVWNSVLQHFPPSKQRRTENCTTQPAPTANVSGQQQFLPLAKCYAVECSFGPWSGASQRASVRGRVVHCGCLVHGYATSLALCPFSGPQVQFFISHLMNIWKGCCWNRERRRRAGKFLTLLSMLNILSLNVQGFRNPDKQIEVVHFLRQKQSRCCIPTRSQFLYNEGCTVFSRGVQPLLLLFFNIV